MFFRKTKIEDTVEKVICGNYNRYYRMIYSFVENEADAADIVQEGAYRAMKNADTLRDPQHASTWVYRIMLNEMYRYTNRRKDLSLEDETVLEPEREDCYEDIDLSRALNAMAVEERIVIQLKYFEELKLDEIAAILDENVNTVKSRLYRGLKKLRNELRGDDGEKAQNRKNRTLEKGADGNV